ncbi:MAG: 1-acyl-sn-glycerol-3-phosphate acyltransferase [Oscillospiraceae bacterium]|nr:1-acyl-sn-glycerol-3-phosphate acyltransferase [Oscillospiraceae bacterium]
MDSKHVRLYRIFRPLVTIFMKLVFGYTYETARSLPKNYIVISNHVTDFDMLAVAASFPNQMYFVASEHVARMKLLYRFVKWAFAPIIRPKGASAAATTMEMVRKARKGDNVCLFAEGVRSWDGVTWPIVPATGRLVKTAGCGLVTYRIEGGYFASPMWSGASIRRGYFHGAPVNVYTPEQLKDMTAAEVQEAIERDLYVDAYAAQRKNPRPYKGKRQAEGLENLLYICPHCGSYDSFTTAEDTVTCADCGLTFRYNRFGFLENAPFETLREFSDWQRAQTEADAERGTEYTASHGVLRRLEDHQEIPVTEGAVGMNGERLCCGDVEIPIRSITDLAMHGQRALVFTADKRYYELLPAKGNNVFKFFLYYDQVKNKKKLRETVR